MVTVVVSEGQARRQVVSAAVALPLVWTGPVILTLIISVLAFVMSGVSLGWQIHSWRRSGAQVVVVTINGIGGDPRWPIEFVGIKATNEGRLGTEVSGCGFLLTNGQTIQAIEDAFGMPIQLPRPLPPGAQVSVHYSLDGLATECSRQVIRVPTHSPTW